ncbi:MAG: TRAP transporter small permease subunit [Xanthomonadales bacterium]|nr:TRAP transporter small permease subunit [Xanthomonadales bacterium]
MRFLQAACARIDALNEWIGRALAWLTLLLVLLVFALVAARYAFSLGSIAAQETTLWLHSMVFLLGAAFTLKRDAHVRVDLVYQRLTPRGRALADLVGTLLLLLPFCAFLLWVSLDYVAMAWSVREGSREPGGLPGVFLLKTLIPIAAALLGLQGIAQAVAAWQRLRTGSESPAHAPGVGP